MKTTHFFSKIMLLAACITSGMYGEIYLSNDSGWDIKFAIRFFGQTEEFELPLKNGQRYDLGSGDAITRLSIRRGGIGSSLISGWTPVSLNHLRNKTKEFLSKRTPNPSFDQHILWSITATNTGWDAQVKGFQTYKK